MCAAAGEFGRGRGVRSLRAWRQLAHLSASVQGRARGKSTPHTSRSSQRTRRSAPSGTACPSARRRCRRRCRPSTAGIRRAARSPPCGAAPSRRCGRRTRRRWRAAAPRGSHRGSRSCTCRGSGRRRRRGRSAARWCRGSRTSSSGTGPAVAAARASAGTSSPASGTHTGRRQSSPAPARPQRCSSGSGRRGCRRDLRAAANFATASKTERRGGTRDRAGQAPVAQRAAGGRATLRADSGCARASGGGRAAGERASCACARGAKREKRGRTAGPESVGAQRLAALARRQRRCVPARAVRVRGIGLRHDADLRVRNECGHQHQRGEHAPHRHGQRGHRPRANSEATLARFI